ncbi:MAG: hypothetical protein HND58_08340 [Planctomycetota bacterium]|nr:MAG: hypothetical protein HND58_08340 [Planctomycetota bacterium]
MSAVAVSQPVRSLFAAAMLAAIVLASAFAFVVATRLEETAAARLALSAAESADPAAAATEPARSVALLVAAARRERLARRPAARPGHPGRAASAWRCWAPRSAACCWACSRR